MAYLRINRDKCKGCMICIAVCPKHALTMDAVINASGNAPVKFSKDAGCTGCCQCALVCPDCCIEVME
jgi:2-oxoglutarate ferredoxin oxidoreductase subunit delta